MLVSVRGGRRTGEVVLVGVVLSVGRAGPKNAPKGATDHALAEAEEVDVEGEGAVFEGFGEVGVVDVILVGEAEEDGEVIVTVCERWLVCVGSGWGISVYSYRSMACV